MSKRRNKCPHCTDGVACWKILSPGSWLTPVRCKPCNGTGVIQALPKKSRP